MAILDYPLNDPENPVLFRDEVYLRYPRANDYQSWAGLRQKSRDHLQPFEPLWTDEEFSRGNYRKRLRIYARDIRAGTARPYFVFRAADDLLLGGCTLSNIRYRAAMTATIGYWIGADHVRRGFGFSALCAVIFHAFDRLDLERLEAACLPENTASQELLRKAGFVLEGRAKGYLRINGERRDHVLFGLAEEDCTYQA